MRLSHVIIMLILCLCISIPLFLSRPFLVTESPAIEGPIDAIIVLGGGRGSRVSHALQLAHTHPPKFMIMTGDSYFDTTVPHLMGDYAINRGFPAPKILHETQSHSTLDHPKNILPLLQENHIKRVVIVTSLFHTRRSARVFRRYFNQHAPDMTWYITGSPDGIDYQSWWRHHEMIETIGFEWIKSLYYMLFLN